MFKHLYSRFLDANPGVLHFAAHSHYYWPDVSREAHLQYWDDSARLVDRKWEYLLEQVIPEAQQHVADRLQTAQPRQVVFAPNTHELVYRLLSCFPDRHPLKVLTTDSEFYSFDRQVRRLEEIGRADVTRVASEPFETFEERFLQSLEKGLPDLVFLSSIFFNSGLGLNSIERVAESARRRDCTLIIDGYHEVGALPVDLSQLGDDLFYLGGGYKYLQSGEGVCFLHVPRSTSLVPANTGWFAEFAELSARRPGQVGFANDGWRFAGATFDPSGIYRFNAVMRMFADHGLDSTTIHRTVMKLQQRFLVEMDRTGHDLIQRKYLVDSPAMRRGHFLALDLGSPRLASELAAQLAAHDVICDVRQSRIRFGFGLYQDEADVEEFFRRLA